MTTQTTSSELIWPLDAPEALLPERSGGKGSSLARLAQDGFPVPAGFVIGTAAYRSFVEANRLAEVIGAALRTLPSRDLTALDQAATTIRQRFEAAAMPEELESAILAAYAELAPAGGSVAVRSSAIAEDLPDASFAGQHESVLQVRGAEHLSAAVKRCWSSLWTARAIAYRRRLALEDAQLALAVVVQLMVPAEMAGVLFTCNPVTGAREELVVNAAPGLGEALVSGQVTPESIVVHRPTGRILERSGGQPEGQGPGPLVASATIGKLASLAQEIERRAGSPQDIEWALAAEQLWVLQARPITTLAPAAASERGPPPGDDAWFPDEHGPVQPYDLWTRANFGEVLPYPVSPLTLSGFRKWGDRMAAQQGDKTEVQLARRMYGRLYANEGAMRQMMVDLGIPSSLLDAMWGSRRPDLPPHGGFRPLRLLSKLPGAIRAMARAGKQPAGEPATQLPKKLAEAFKRVDAWADEARGLALDQLSDDELWRELQGRWEERYLQMMQRHSQLSQQAFLSFALLRGALRRWTGDPLLAPRLIAGVTGLHSAAMGARLREIASALEQHGLGPLLLDKTPEQALSTLRATPEAAPALKLLDAFLEEYGHHCIAEPELLLPRWVEQPAELLVWLASYLRAPDRHAALAPPGAASWEQTRDQALSALRGIRRKIVLRLLDGAHQAVRTRDNSRYHLARLNLPRRRLYAELGRRWHQRDLLGAPDDIFFLLHHEIEAAIAGGSGDRPLGEIAARRRAAYDYWCGVEAPEALDAQERPLPPAQQPALGQPLEGIAASPGQVTGVARLIDDPRQASRLRPGDILVTRATDPSWTPIFPLVKGLVLEIGGQLSHGAIIAREYGLPAVVNVYGALSTLRDGEPITVDGTTGRVYQG